MYSYPNLLQSKCTKMHTYCYKNPVKVILMLTFRKKMVSNAFQFRIIFRKRKKGKSKEESNNEHTSRNILTCPPQFIDTKVSIESITVSNSDRKILLWGRGKSYFCGSFALFIRNCITILQEIFQLLTDTFGKIWGLCTI